MPSQDGTAPVQDGNRPVLNAQQEAQMQQMRALMDKQRNGTALTAEESALLASWEAQRPQKPQTK